jgi:hypothetical protein
VYGQLSYTLNKLITKGEGALYLYECVHIGILHFKQNLFNFNTEKNMLSENQHFVADALRMMWEESLKLSK